MPFIFVYEKYILKTRPYENLHATTMGTLKEMKFIVIVIIKIVTVKFIQIGGIFFLFLTDDY